MDGLPNPVILLGVLAVLGLAPFIAIMVSSYLKLVVVMYILRNAIGLQQVPPNLAVNGLAIILSIYIMAPIGMQVVDVYQSHEVSLNNLENPELLEAALDSLEPIRDFLVKHSDEIERSFFAETSKKMWPAELASEITHTHFLVLLPAFTISQLKAGFETGFLLYLPFITIDLIVSNILLAMGMMMVSPMTISLPFKILLFVLVDGWTRLVHGLVLSFQ